jgi:hypothetical protein
MLTLNETLLDELKPYSETKAKLGRKSTKVDFKML